ncbi:hypothetical protein K490DRAFT_72736 [Saccharata proteae CBS 121410]|uniref:Zn(2)-C6 fungal-type domain-containing protein n=1 Tax=Saccharata proteae CBS 121410 TaxID=1314787 RepID=A0A6A5YCP3_9PEZI|nr:hypothetical protein K490DRAFT_72736 [Saccharata proteae CBS 121410]
MSANGGQSHSPSNDVETPDGSVKRRHDGDSAPQPRAKRNRYISIACNECKRRKIKCNGQTPCQRCGNLQLECQYTPNCCNNFKDSEEFKSMNVHITSLQEQVDALYSNLNALRAHVETSSVATDPSLYTNDPYQRPVSISQASVPEATPNNRTQQPLKHPRFHGPTSTAFNLGVAKSSLQTMGITAPEEPLEDGAFTQDGTPLASPPPPTSNNAYSSPIMHASKDPIWAISKEEALRLCTAWYDEMGIMYPVLEPDRVLRHVESLYKFMEAAHRTRLVEVAFPGADSINDDQTILLKLVLATAMVLEASGKSELGTSMFDSVRSFVEARILASVDVNGIKMLSVTAMFLFHRDEEAQAWRVIGLAARLCMELGLHRRETYNLIFTDDSERAAAVRLFWSVYVLDRRWSFGTGMPFAFEDADIDPQLPKPDDSTPYLNCMIAYSNIGSRVWKSVANAENSSISKEEIGYLDYQAIQWHRTIPTTLKYVHPSSTVPQEHQVSRNILRFRILLYLRANQMRILIYRPVLHTATSIMEDVTHAQTVVDVAKDTINVLTHTNQTTDIYRRHQVMFNYFLLSALAVLFLAVSHAPAHFSECCRDEFYMALDLVRGLSSNSYVSKRLWRTIKVLKEVGPKLGLNMRGPQTAAGTSAAGHSVPVDPSDPHSSAAVAMAGLAGHPVDEMLLFGSNGNGNRNGGHRGSQSNHTGSSLARGYGQNNSPNGMANDLTSLFEAAGAYAAATTSSASGFPTQSSYYITSNGGNTQVAHTAAGANGTDDELARILRDLF